MQLSNDANQAMANTIREFLNKAQEKDEYTRSLETTMTNMNKTIQKKDAKIHHLQSAAHTTQQDSMKKMTALEARIKELEAQVQSRFSESDLPDYESDENVAVVQAPFNKSDSHLPDYESDDDVQFADPHLNDFDFVVPDYDSDGVPIAEHGLDDSEYLPDYDSDDTVHIAQQPLHDSAIYIDLAQILDSESDGEVSLVESHLNDSASTQSYDSKYEDGSIEEDFNDAYEAFEAGSKEPELYSQSPLQEPVNDWDTRGESNHEDLYDASLIRKHPVNDWGCSRGREEYEVDDENEDYEDHERYGKRGKL